MKTPSTTIPVRELGNTLAEIIKSQVRLGTQLIDSMSQLQLPESKSCCDIPEPCWMPVSLGEIESFACQGATVVVRLMITNCDRISHTYTSSAAGVNKDRVQLQPASLLLGPKERGTILATIDIPADINKSQDFEILLWIRGCKEYYVRWNISTNSPGGDGCHEIEIEDCPDLIHHWYDHFYCVRSCNTGRNSTINDNVRG